MEKWSDAQKSEDIIKLDGAGEGTYVTGGNDCFNTIERQYSYGKDHLCAALA